MALSPSGYLPDGQLFHFTTFGGNERDKLEKRGYRLVLSSYVHIIKYFIIIGLLLVNVAQFLFRQLFQTPW